MGAAADVRDCLAGRNAEGMIDRGDQVAGRDGVLGGISCVPVGLTVYHAAAGSAAGQHRGEATGPVITTVGPRAGVVGVRAWGGTNALAILPRLVLSIASAMVTSARSARIAPSSRATSISARRASD